MSGGALRRVRALLRQPEETRDSILRKLGAIHRYRIEQEGYREGPSGERVPPGFRMVSDEALARLGWRPDGEGEGEGSD